MSVSIQIGISFSNMQCIFIKETFGKKKAQPLESSEWNLFWSVFRPDKNTDCTFKVNLEPKPFGKMNSDCIFNTKRAAIVCWEIETDWWGEPECVEVQCLCKLEKWRELSGDAETNNSLQPHLEKVLKEGSAGRSLGLKMEDCKWGLLYQTTANIEESSRKIRLRAIPAFAWIGLFTRFASRQSGQTTLFFPECCSLNENRNAISEHVLAIVSCTGNSNKTLSLFSSKLASYVGILVQISSPYRQLKSMKKSFWDQLFTK